MRVLVAAVLIAAATPGLAATASIPDGNTLILNNVTYALQGIDAPQTDQTCIDDKAAPWRCGIAARDALREHVGKREVRCTDRGADGIVGKRRVGECTIEGEAISLNQWMVQQGWALNVDRSAKGRFKADRDKASAEGLGLWNGCFIAPDDLRRITISTAPLLGKGCPKRASWKVRETLFPEYPVMPAGCDIKGKTVLRSQAAGYRGIYHLASCRSHPRTKPVHRWFCTEDEAQAAGFRKSYTC